MPEPPQLAAGSHGAAGAAEYSDHWTAPGRKIIFRARWRDLAQVSLHPPGEKSGERDNLIVWPESPAPFFTNDPRFREPVSELAKQSGSWVIAGAIGINPATQIGAAGSQIFNSAALVSPQGEWTARYDKVHLVPFGEYLPFPQLFRLLRED